MMEPNAASSTFSNPSVIPGSAFTPINGPRVDSIKYTIYATDTASLGSVLSGTNQIVDITPSIFSDVQTALSTTFLNVTTQAGASFEDLIFNMCDTNAGQPLCTRTPPGSFLPFRQAMAHLINYSYIQETVLSGIQGIATPSLYLPSAFVGYSPTSFTIYENSLKLANQSLAQDPQIAWSATDKQPASSNAIACNGATGVWEWATSVGSGKPNGTAFEPQLITRPDHPTWFTWAQQFWNSAAQIGLCINLRQVVHFSSVAPIIYNNYNSGWDMYDGGQSFSGLLDALGNGYFSWTPAGFPAGPFSNTPHFQNATMTQLLTAAYYSTNTTFAQEKTSQALGMLQQQIPSIGLWWDNVLIPSVNNFNGQYWAGYVNVPGFSTYQTGSQYYTSLSVHRVDPTTGKTIVGGTFGVAQHEAPDGFNVLNDNSVYDADVYNMIYWDSPMIYTPDNPTLGGLTPWMLTGQPNTLYHQNATTPHGYKMVNGMAITMNFMNNITFSDNVPFTARDYNFSLWYINPNGAILNASKYASLPYGGCNLPCWAKYANNVALRLTGLIPDIIDSQVNPTNAYQMTVYMNNTGIEDYFAAVDGLVIPQHLWSQVNSTAVANDIQPELATSAINGNSLAAGPGGFEFGQYVQNQYTTVYRFPGYFKTDIQDWSLAGTAGQGVSLSLNMTQMGVNTPPVPIPSSANVKAWLVQNGNPLTSTQTTLSLSGGSWTGSIPTTGLGAGFYEIVANGTYTDSGGLFHTALQFWGLNLASGGGQTSTTSVGSSQSTASGGSSTTASGSSSQTATTSAPPVTSSTTTSAGTDYTLIAAVVVVVIIIAGVAAYVIRRR